MSRLAGTGKAIRREPLIGYLLRAERTAALSTKPGGCMLILGVVNCHSEDHHS